MMLKFSEFPLFKGIIATVATGSAYTVSELQLLDLRLRIALSICGLIIGIPIALAALWHAAKWIYAIFQTKANHNKSK